MIRCYSYQIISNHGLPDCEFPVHELAVTQHILDIVTDHAQKAGATRVTDIHIVIGDLSSVVDDSVQMYWGILTEGSMAAGSKLHFKRIPAQMHCKDCEKDYSPSKGELLCPTCGGANVKVTGGDDFRLDSIEVETEKSRET